MKIALVSPYDFAYPGGVANHILNLDRHLTRLGHDVRIIAPASRSITISGDRFIPIGKPRPIPSNGSITRITISPMILPRIKAVLAREKFDIIHLHEPFVPMLCTNVLRLSDTATVATFHASGGWGYYSIRPFGTLLLKKWFKKLNGCIAVSATSRDYVHSYFMADYEIIPNGVDTEHFSPYVSPLPRFQDGKLNVLFVGRLERRKGVSYLLKAWAKVKKEIPESRLIIVGPGTRLRKKYQRQVAKNKLDDVTFIGGVGYDELPRYYATADVFCAPATGGESFGIVLLEAMASGKPVVATNIAGYANVLAQGQEGLLVPPKNPRMLAEALISLLSDERLRHDMGTRGRLAARKYDWEILTRRILDCYLRAINGSARRRRQLQLEGAPTLLVD
ncbi:MAG: glycosyltransferase family 4 protein [Chloroflexi bacterium]|nr:glycosyltransferase family 4 protein [Chloroflexota bacterium]